MASPGWDSSTSLPLLVVELLEVEDVGFGVHRAPGVHAHLEALLLDQPHEQLDQLLALVRLVHHFEGGAYALRRARGTPSGRFPGDGLVALQGLLDGFQALVALGELVYGLPVGGVADQEPELPHPVQGIGDALQAGDEEVAHGEAGRVGGVEGSADALGELDVAVVYEVTHWFGPRPVVRSSRAFLRVVVRA